MTADEREKIGRLIGTAEAQERRLAAIEDALGKLDEKLDGMQQHVAPVAAQLAKELASYRVDEAKWKVEFVGPLRDKVDSLVKWRIYLTGALAATLLYITYGLRAWDVFH